MKERVEISRAALSRDTSLVFARRTKCCCCNFECATRSIRLLQWVDRYLRGRASCPAKAARPAFFRTAAATLSPIPPGQILASGGCSFVEPVFCFSAAPRICSIMYIILEFFGWFFFRRYTARRREMLRERSADAVKRNSRPSCVIFSWNLHA